MNIRIIFLAPFGLLTACGGSTTVTEVAGAVAHAPAPPAITDPGALPLTGSATYAGPMTLTLPPAGNVLVPGVAHDGNLRLTAKFGAAPFQIAGVANGFAPQGGGGALAGDLAVSRGVIDRGTNTRQDFTFEAEIDGTLSGAGVTSMDVDGVLTGDFIGVDYGTLRGLATGDVNTIDGIAIFGGSFEVTRN